jgi:hypothetical protein
MTGQHQCGIVHIPYTPSNHMLSINTRLCVATVNLCLRDNRCNHDADAVPPLPWCTTAAAVPPAKSLGFADGGALHNYAIMPLLRRGVKCLIVLVSSSTPPDDTWQRFRDGKHTGQQGHTCGCTACDMMFVTLSRAVSS